MSSTARNVVIVIALLVAGGVGFLLVNYFYNESASTGPRPHVVVPKKPGVVYSATFDTDKAGEEWSSRRLSTTPKPKRRFLGPFLEEPVTFTVDGLPKHEMIHLTFELLTHDPWNGDSANFGRDLWDMRVVGGQSLIHTTFSNCGFFRNNNEQSFPDQYPWYPTHEGWTGTATKQSLGYTNSWGQGPMGTDSTYAFDLLFPHSADTLQLQFKSQIRRHEDKPYGFLNLKVETVDHPVAATDEQLAAWWKDLADEDPIKAYKALWSLVATADAATRYIRPRMPPADPSIPVNIDQKAMWEHGSFEYATPEARQRAREIHVLEAISSQEAKSILKQIGFDGTPQGGPPTHWDR